MSDLRNAILRRIYREPNPWQRWWLCDGCEAMLTTTSLKAKRCTQCDAPIVTVRQAHREDWEA